MEDVDLKQLESRVETLLRTVERLQEENRSLREHQQSLMTERAQLIEKTELARSRVEGMITRLKSMEQE
ncbi:cell division protein ZapB [Thiohalospira halophila DSM 15071]|jgi:cell division protein ZapB|uniref:Cell division protein ZapB n=1 Tax=Thiohalospira halophila DSM 15071 TaxID=1123397 RepID=A0A1I1SFF2_9GAMM|nr:TIGR02449 family protein [Thiohalospira halophila]SFD43368.1 cell division protein ZapB [Thiohalospira halophila DSM 15071]